MKDISITLRFIKNMAQNFIINGILAIFTGILIMIFPDFLPYLVGALFIVFGISFWIIAQRLYKYSTIHFKI